MPGISFLKVLEKFTNEEQKEIRGNLNEFILSGKDGIIGDQILNENHVEDLDEYERVVRIFLTKHEEYRDLCIEVYKELNERKKRVGREIHPKPERVGKVLIRHKYETLLAERHHMDEEDIKDFYEDIRHGRLEDYKDLFVSKGLTWVTWNEENSTGDPFHFVEPVARNRGWRSKLIARNLGLKAEFEELNLVAFIYTLDDRSIRYPTCVEASGYFHFRSAPEGSPSGYTRHHNDGIPEELREFEIKPRPEGVHDDLRFSDPSEIKHREFY